MKLLLILALLMTSSLSWAEGDHDHEHDEGKKHQDSSKGHDESEEKGHDDDHHEEQKLPGGVTSFEDQTGEFSLKEKVIQNFGIEIQSPVKSGGYIEVPERAIVRSLKATSIFTFENGKFKSVPVKVMNSSTGIVRITTDNSITKVVVKGNNFLQTILLSLEEGPSEGHGH